MIKKINIRINSVFEGFKVALNTLYFLIFKCFAKNMNIKKTHIEAANFCKIMNQPKPSLKTIIKVFRKLRCKIKEYYHKQWDNTPLGLEPTDEVGIAKVEIDESEIIGNSHKIIWMFVIIDRSNKDARVFSVLHNRRK